MTWLSGPISLVNAREKTTTLNTCNLYSQWPPYVTGNANTQCLYQKGGSTEDRREDEAMEMQGHTPADPHRVFNQVPLAARSFI